MKKKEEILKEAARSRKAAEQELEMGHYMSWQKLLSRENALLWCLEKEGCVYERHNCTSNNNTSDNSNINSNNNTST